MSVTVNDKQADEQKLIADLKNPDTRRAAYTRLVTAYQEQLYWQIRKLVINHDDTADVLQNTLLKVWQNLDSFRGDSKLATWMYTIAHNEALNFLTKMQAERELTLDDPEGYMQNQIEGDKYFDGDETQKRLLQAIATLPAKQRQVFNMRYYDEMPYEDISSILGTSVGALKASYHFAVEKITAYFKRFED
ncbi:MAG: RNA polymerase sigma factor [Bacteroidales bacterium]|nr:RNA polymerase sigma factor [Candidatus Liminaster caballi]